MPLLSVAIVTFNEEENLARTLASVAWADQIIIVDSGSADRTVEIAHSFNATVLERPWPGFAEQKNFALSQCTSDWILTLDADEELTAELQQQIRQTLSTDPAADAFYLKRRNLFLGRWIKHGGFYPDPKLRLFRRGAAQFEERAVHETVQFPGDPGHLHGDLLHHAYPTLQAYIEHMNAYSALGAQQAIQKGKIGRGILPFLWNVWVNPVATFHYNYFLRGGFLDGREGLLLHLYHSVYVSWKYAKAWEIARKLAVLPRQ